MAPTICEDERSVTNTRRTRNRIMKHRNSTVISYAGRRMFDQNTYDSTSNSDSSSSSSSSSSSDSNTESSPTKMPVPFPTASDSDNASSSALDSLEYRGIIERNNRQNKLQIDDDSMDSCSQSTDESNTENVTKRSRSTSHVIDDDASLLSMPSTPLTSTSSLYDDLTYTKRRPITPHHQQLTICSLPSPSSVSSADAVQSVLMCRLTTHHHALPRRSQQRGLLEIALKTVKLLQRNRSLQARLDQLQLETRQFVDSVMANPENCDLRDRIKYNAISQ